MVEQAAAAAETAPAPAKSISEMLQQFYQHHADRKWDEEYQELLKKAVSYLLARVMDYTRIVYAHIPAPHVYQLEPANIPDYLGKVLLPELQQTLLRLSRAMDPSQLAENDLEERKAWYDSNMHHFVHIDDQLEELDDVRSTLWRKLPLGKGLLRHDDNNHHSYVQLTNFRARQTQYKVRTLLAEPIARVLAACDSFFHAVSFSNPATDKRLLSSRWGVIARRINSSNDHMDCFIKWLQQPLVNIAKEEWQKMVEKIETLLRSLLKHLNPLYHKFEKGYESSSDDELVPLNPTAMKFVRMGLTVLKICRIYFNKLSRATNSQPLIFAQSCMEMDMKYLKRLLTCTQDAQTFISVFATELRALPSHRR